MNRRPICKDQDCSVQIEEGKKYCAGHSYLIDRWVAKSYAILVRALTLSAAK